MIRVWYAAALVLCSTAVLAQDLVVSGKVYKPGIHPVQAYVATVRIRSKDHPDQKESKNVSESEGFSFSSLAPGSYELVSVQNPWYYLPGCLSVDDLRAPRTGIQLNLGMFQKDKMVGVLPVHDPGGHFVKDLQVKIVLNKCDDWEQPRISITNNRGEANFADIPYPENGHIDFFVKRGRAWVPVPERQSRQEHGPSLDPDADAAGPLVDQIQTPGESEAGNQEKELHLETVSGKRPGIPLVVSDEIRIKSLTVDFADGVITADVGMSAREKLRLHTLRLFTFASLFLPAVPAAINQWRNTPHEWGQGALGFSRRYGTAYLYSFGVRNSMAFALDSTLHQDPRYFPSIRHRWARLSDCLLQTVTTRTDGGDRTFNTWRIGSAYAAGLFSTIWYPTRVATIGDAMWRGTVALSLDTAANVLREFSPEIRRDVHLARLESILGSHLHPRSDSADLFDGLKPVPAGSKSEH
jgi:hypothetical protein